MHILLVDDDPVARDVHGAWLTHHGYQVSLAAHPIEADRLLAQEEFSLILTDIHMPGNERLEWVEQIIQRPLSPPIILLTGYPEFETACRASNLQVAGYLVKPLDFELLRATLRRVLAEQRQRTEFLSLSREILGLLAHRRAHGPTEEDALIDRLLLLTRHFVTHPPGGAGDSAVPPSDDDTWRNAIRETIKVIEKTKDSFRSKDLGQLRVRLQGLLDRSKLAAKSGSEKNA